MVEILFVAGRNRRTVGNKFVVCGAFNRPEANRRNLYLKTRKGRRGVRRLSRPGRRYSGWRQLCPLRLEALVVWQQDFVFLAASIVENTQGAPGATVFGIAFELRAALAKELFVLSSLHSRDSLADNVAVSTALTLSTKNVESFF